MMPEYHEIAFAMKKVFDPTRWPSRVIGFDDLVHETWIRVQSLAEKPGFPPINEPLLVGIARKVMLNIYKRELRRKPKDIPMPEKEAPRDPVAKLFGLNESSPLSGLTDSLLNRLEPDQRSLITEWASGDSVDEICERRGVAKKTIQNNLSLARKQAGDLFTELYVEKFTGFAQLGHSALLDQCSDSEQLVPKREAVEEKVIDIGRNSIEKAILRLALAEYYITLHVMARKCGIYTRQVLDRAMALLERAKSIGNDYFFQHLRISLFMAADTLRALPVPFSFGRDLPKHVHPIEWREEYVRTGERLNRYFAFPDFYHRTASPELLKELYVYAFTQQHLPALAGDCIVARK